MKDDEAVKPDAFAGKTKDLLPQYYRRFFPADLMYEWIGYGSDEYFEKREWSFTKDDIYMRYQSFNNVKSFKDGVCAKNPDKMDIGPVYNTATSNHSKVGNFIPQEKELVFDIDATDYADVFVNKESTDFITSLTWPLMSMAIEVLDTILRNDFGFEHILYVFSGRRGIHAWVCDKKARLLTNHARSAIAEYLQVIQMNDNSTKKVFLKNKLHPTLENVFNKILLPGFEKYFIEDQQLLNDPDHIAKILLLVSEEDRENIAQNWKNNPKELSDQRWRDLKMTIESRIKNTKFNKSNPIYDIVFTYTYPRLDINVSKQLNHLLKSPFVIHPGSGRVCVAIDRANVKNFKPEDVPTVNRLMAELNAYKPKKSDPADIPDYQKTSLNSYVELFSKFVNNLENDVDLIW
jgi:DNA primase small subunit